MFEEKSISKIKTLEQKTEEIIRRPKRIRHPSKHLNLKKL